MRLAKWWIIILPVLLFVPVVFGQENEPKTIIQADNAAQLVRQSVFGCCVFNQASWSADSATLMVAGTAGITLYDAHDWDHAPRIIPLDNRIRYFNLYPNSHLALTYDFDSRVQVWDTDAGSLVYESSETGVHAARLSPDRTLLALDYFFGPLQVVDLATGEVVHELDSASPLWFSPDNKTMIVLVEVGSDRFIKVIDLDEEQILRTIPSQWNSVVSRDGRLMATQVDDTENGGELAIWSLETGEKVAELLEYQSNSGVVPVGGQAWPMRFSDDGSMLALVIYHSFPSESPNEVLVWHFKNGQMVTGLGEFSDQIQSLDFSSDGSLLVVAEDYSYEIRSAHIRVWDTTTGELHGISDSYDSPQTWKVAFNPADTQILSVHSDGIVRIWDAQTVELLATLGNSYVDALLSPNGEWLITKNDLNEIQVWSIDRVSGSYQTSATRQVATDMVHYYMALSPDGSQLAFTTGARWRADGVYTLQLWDIDADTVDILLSQYDEHLGPLAFSPDGSRLAATLRQGAFFFLEEGIYTPIQLWDTATKDPVGAPLMGHHDFVTSLTFSPDGQTLASGACGGRDVEGTCDTGEIIVWDVATGEIRLGPWQEHTSAVYALSFSPDGNILASGSGGPIYWGSLVDYSIVLWDTATGEPLLPPLLALPNHDDSFSVRGEVRSLAFGPDGNLLVAGNGDSVFGNDSTLRIWEVATGNEVVKLDDHSTAIQSVVFSPDGTAILATSNDGLLRVWSLP